MTRGHLQSLKESHMHNPSRHHFLRHENAAQHSSNVPEYSFGVVCFQFKCLPSWPGDSFPLSPGSNSFIRNLANKVFSTCQPCDIIRHSSFPTMTFIMNESWAYFTRWYSLLAVCLMCSFHRSTRRPQRSFAILCQLVLGLCIILEGYRLSLELPPGDSTSKPNQPQLTQLPKQHLLSGVWWCLHNTLTHLRNKHSLETDNWLNERQKARRILDDLEWPAVPCRHIILVDSGLFQVWFKGRPAWQSRTSWREVC